MAAEGDFQLDVQPVTQPPPLAEGEALSPSSPQPPPMARGSPTSKPPRRVGLQICPHNTKSQGSPGKVTGRALLTPYVFLVSQAKINQCPSQDPGQASPEEAGPGNGIPAPPSEAGHLTSPTQAPAGLPSPCSLACGEHVAGWQLGLRGARCRLSWQRGTHTLGGGHLWGTLPSTFLRRPPPFSVPL